MYASFLGISEALHLSIFRQPLEMRLPDSLFIPFREEGDKGGGEVRGKR
jgi:hypothetical protein